MKLIGIGGGSGSGKSTVSYALAEANPDTFEVINLDDYQKLKTDPNLPMFEGMINWDHPDAIRWDTLLSDIKQLQANQPVTLDVWTSHFNPNYYLTGRLVPRTIKPKLTMIVEGYLALYEPALRDLFDRTFYLDLDAATRTERRDKSAIIRNPEYETKVLPAMHNKYVQPTKQWADVVIEVAYASVEQICDIIRISFDL